MNRPRSSYSISSAAMSTFAHHGIIYVPLGYKHAFGQLTNLNEVHGGSPWGAGMLLAWTRPLNGR